MSARKGRSSIAKLESKSKEAGEGSVEGVDPAIDASPYAPSKRKLESQAIEISPKGDIPKSSKRSRTSKVQKIKAEDSERPLSHEVVREEAKGVEEELVNGASPLKKKRKTKATEEVVVKEKAATPLKQKRKIKSEAREEELDNDGKGETTIKRKRKTQEQKEAEAMPLAARSQGLKMYVGAHVSSAKGVQNSVTNCVHVGGNVFAMFLKSQRKWENPPLQNEHRDLFVSNCGEHKYDSSSQVLPHGSYLVNLAQEEQEKATQAYNAFLDDLHRCESLGIRLYNFHPGWTGKHARPAAIARIAQALNRAHQATSKVKPVLETMAGGGNVIGSTFEDLRDIIALVDNKERVGVCIDTCHIFAAGYDLRTPTAFRKTLDEFDKIVGIKYLRALHLNDSKGLLGSHRDLHQNIGLGFLGLRAFHNVMNEPRFEGLPMVLETPIDHKDPETGKEVEDKKVWATEIKMLEHLIGMDAESDEFKILAQELADRGSDERKKLQEQFDKKIEKERKATEKGQTKLLFDKTNTHKDSKESKGS